MLGDYVRFLVLQSVHLHASPIATFDLSADHSCKFYLSRPCEGRVAAALCSGGVLDSVYGALLFLHVHVRGILTEQRKDAEQRGDDVSSP